MLKKITTCLILTLFINVIILSDFAYADIIGNNTVENSGISVVMFLNKKDITIYNDYIIKAFELDTAPIAPAGTTLVPIRAVAEAFDSSVEWKENIAKVLIAKGDTKVELALNSDTAIVNSKPMKMSEPVRILNGRTVVPLRFVTEALGYNVDWVEPKNEIIITNNPIVRNERDLYILIKKALENDEDKIDFTIDDNSNIPEYDKVVNLVLDQHPELNYSDSFLYSHYISSYIKFNYICPKDKLQQIINEVNAKAKEIIDGIIKPNMSDLDKAKAIHDYIVKNTKYDYENFKNNTVPKESYTAYGVLIKGIGVCQGYAAAFNLLAKMAGIDSLGVSGIGTNTSISGPHAWNMIRIGGKISYIDATWDDPVPDQNDRVIYDYFNITEQQMEKDHTWDKSEFTEQYFDYK